MCQSTQIYYHDSEPTCLCSYFLIHLYCVLALNLDNMSEWIDTSTHGLLLALNLDNMSEWIDTSSHGLLLALNLDNMSEWIDTVLCQPRAQTYNLPLYSLFCANPGLKPTIYRTIPCFVPTQGSNLQSTALFPVYCRFEPLGWDKTGNSAVDCKFEPSVGTKQGIMR
jgi:hypothetical protein